MMGERYYQPGEDFGLDQNFHDVLFVDIYEDDDDGPYAECKDVDGEAMFYVENYASTSALQSECNRIFGSSIDVQVI